MRKFVDNSLFILMLIIILSAVAFAVAGCGDTITSSW